MTSRADPTRQMTSASTLKNRRADTRRSLQVDLVEKLIVSALEEFFVADRPLADQLNYMGRAERADQHLEPAVFRAGRAAVDQGDVVTADAGSPAGVAVIVSKRNPGIKSASFHLGTIRSARTVPGGSASARCAAARRSACDRFATALGWSRIGPPTQGPLQPYFQESITLPAEGVNPEFLEHRALFSTRRNSSIGSPPLGLKLGPDSQEGPAPALRAKIARIANAFPKRDRAEALVCGKPVRERRL